jgi:pimeloyl-ACP methyl ester carboxylesterase
MYIQLDDLKMFYYDNHATHKPVMVFIHGLGENLNSWHNQIDYFKTDYRVIAMDLRGHNRTDDGTKAITIKQFAADVIALLDVLQIQQAHIVGLSMGGIIAQQLAIDYPERILTLSLCDTACYATDEAKAKLDGRIEMIKSISMDEMANFIVTACLPAKYDQKIYDEAFAIFRVNRQAPYLAATVATFSIDFRNDLPKITLPTLVFTGELDKATPVEAAECIHKLIPHSEMHVIPGVGHLSKLEKPGEFNQLIEDFLSRNK